MVSLYLKGMITMEQLKVFDENYTYLRDESRERFIAMDYGMKHSIAGYSMKSLSIFKKEVP